MMRISNSVLFGLLIFGVSCVCLARAQERHPQPGFFSHSINYYQPNDDCDQVKVQFAMANGTVHVTFSEPPSKMSGTHLETNFTYFFGDSNCKIKLTLSRP